MTLSIDVAVDSSEILSLQRQQREAQRTVLTDRATLASETARLSRRLGTAPPSAPAPQLTVGPRPNKAPYLARPAQPEIWVGQSNLDEDFLAGGIFEVTRYFYIISNSNDAKDDPQRIAFRVPGAGTLVSGGLVSFNEDERTAYAFISDQMPLSTFRDQISRQFPFATYDFEFVKTMAGFGPILLPTEGGELWWETRYTSVGNVQNDNGLTFYIGTLDIDDQLSFARGVLSADSGMPLATISWPYENDSTPGLSRVNVTQVLFPGLLS